MDVMGPIGAVGRICFAFFCGLRSRDMCLIYTIEA